MTKVFVGFNGTATAIEATFWAAAEAAARRCGLVIVSCYAIPISGAEPGAAILAFEGMTSLVDDTVASAKEIRTSVLADHADLDVKVVVSSGPASEELIRDADRDDLVVVGASSRDGFAGFLLGSTARSVARRSPCPVVVVNGAATRGTPDRVVVGIDGSPASDEAVRWAADEADMHQVPLLVVHAWEYPYPTLDVGSEQARDLFRIDAATILNSAVDLARERSGGEVESALVEHGPTSGVLESVRDGDLLVLGSRGRGGIRAGLFGSTVNNVLDHAVIPVVVVRDPAE